MDKSDIRNKRRIVRGVLLGFALLFLTTTAMINVSTGKSATDDPEQCKLLVTKGFTITQIDGKKKTVNSGKTIKIPSGKRIITYNHTFMRTMGGLPSELSKFGDKIEFEFEAGKSYKLDTSAEVEDSYIKQPGPPEITEIDLHNK